MYTDNPALISVVISKIYCKFNRGELIVNKLKAGKNAPPPKTDTPPPKAMIGVKEILEREQYDDALKNLYANVTGALLFLAKEIDVNNHHVDPQITKRIVAFHSHRAMIERGKIKSIDHSKEPEEPANPHLR